ncbi:hypothetical protein HZC00_04265 [Candidatus Kaiserbacteria bacterium]|nr:hypothetical protein [Candidatus Kaiserbacteria bacterium]
MAKKQAAKKKVIGFNDLNDKLDRMIDAMVTHDDLKRLEERLDQKIDKRVGEILTAIDRLAKVVSDLSLEYAAVSVQLSRHEEWIRLIAQKTGVNLPS